MSDDAALPARAFPAPGPLAGHRADTNRSPTSGSTPTMPAATSFVGTTEPDGVIAGLPPLVARAPDGPLDRRGRDRRPRRSCGRAGRRCDLGVREDGRRGREPGSSLPPRDGVGYSGYNGGSLRPFGRDPGHVVHHIMNPPDDGGDRWVIERGDGIVAVYQYFDLPFPVSDRDPIIRTVWWSETAGRYEVRWAGVSGRRAHQAGRDPLAEGRGLRRDRGRRRWQTPRPDEGG
jgi:hypothetical protein